MPTILVVDDSAVDRRLAKELLADKAGYDVRFAVNGAEALAALAADKPDLVIADLLMPGVGGLELTQTIRRDYPEVPVILMTSRGNEEIAVEALQSGAASYVPKRLMPQRMADTVNEVLQAAHADRCAARVLSRLAWQKVCFRIDNDASLIAPLVTWLQNEVFRLGVCSAADRTRIGIALNEAIANALYHGNLEIESELRDFDAAAYHELAERRRHEHPYCNRVVEVEADLSATEAAFEIRDQGKGFDHRNLLDPTDPANLTRTFGRGILLMRTFMDEVTFNPTGNAVRMVKRV